MRKCIDDIVINIKFQRDMPIRNNQTTPRWFGLGLGVGYVICKLQKFFRLSDSMDMQNGETLR